MLALLPQKLELRGAGERTLPPVLHQRPQEHLGAEGAGLSTHAPGHQRAGLAEQADLGSCEPGPAAGDARVEKERLCEGRNRMHRKVPVQEYGALLGAQVPGGQDALAR